MSFHNIAKMTSATGGTGTLTLGTAVPGCNTFANAGVTNGEVVTYVIRDGANSEAGYGTYTSIGTTLSRDTVLSSTDGGSKINCSGRQTVAVTVAAETLNLIDPYGLHHRLSGSNAFDDEFGTDTSANYTTVTPTGSATWTVSNHCANVVYSSQSSQDAACFLKALTISDGQWLETAVRGMSLQSANYSFRGLVISNGVTAGSSAATLGAFQSSVTGQIAVRFDYGTITALSSSTGNVNMDAAQQNGTLRMRFKRNNSAQYIWQIGVESGGIFSDFGSAAVNPGFTPTHGGLFVSSFGGAQTYIASFDYLRLMS